MKSPLIHCIAVFPVLPLLTGCDVTQSASVPTTDAPATVSATPPDESGQPPTVQLAANESERNVPQEDILELEWDELIPANWRPDTLMAEYDADNLSDDDPRAQTLMDKLKALWNESPVVSELDGKLVKLPGFVVPLEMSTETIGEFLLVPYYGACIHVPPPLANQTVYVIAEKGNEYRGKLFDTVWVTGTIKVEHLSSELAEAGYRIRNARVEPFE